MRFYSYANINQEKDKPLSIIGWVYWVYLARWIIVIARK
jgi:hypothetical protein